MNTKDRAAYQLLFERLRPGTTSLLSIGPSDQEMSYLGAMRGGRCGTYVADGAQASDREGPALFFAARVGDGFDAGLTSPAPVPAEGNLAEGGSV